MVQYMQEKHARDNLCLMFENSQGQKHGFARSYITGSLIKLYLVLDPIVIRSAVQLELEDKRYSCIIVKGQKVAIGIWLIVISISVIVSSYGMSQQEIKHTSVVKTVETITKFLLRV